MGAINIIQGNIEVLEKKWTKEILIMFYNGSNYDYHFIIKELEEESEG